MKNKKESTDRKIATWVAAKVAVDAVWAKNEIVKVGVHVWDLRAAYEAREARAAKAVWNVYVAAIRAKELD